MVLPWCLWDMVRTQNGPAVTGHKYGVCMEPHQIGLPAPVSQAIAQNLRGSSLSVLETIAPSETVLDPIPEEDDNPRVAHRARYEEMETGIETGNPVWTFVACSATSVSPRIPPFVGPVKRPRLRTGGMTRTSGQESASPARTA